MKARILSLVVIAFTSLCSVSAFADDMNKELAEFTAAIRKMYDLKEQGFANNDPDSIVTKFYSPDAISTDPEGVTRIGTAELLPMYQEFTPIYNVKVKSVHPYVNGDAGWDWADFAVEAKVPEEESFNIKILFLWERVNGAWICKGDIYVMGSFEDPAPAD